MSFMDWRDRVRKEYSHTIRPKYRGWAFEPAIVEVMMDTMEVIIKELIRDNEQCRSSRQDGACVNVLPERI